MAASGFETLTAAACAVLEMPVPNAKVALSLQIAAEWRNRRLVKIGDRRPPDTPRRPQRPLLRPPRDMARRRRGQSRSGRTALLHAVTHIELNAIDLAWDLIARFAAIAPHPDFFDDWVRVACEEALHFRLLARRLVALDCMYGDLPAHDGLWQAAHETRHDILARLAIVPLVLEARGLDVTPAMIRNLERAGDAQSGTVLRRIYLDEIGHVAVGLRWFNQIAQDRGLDPRQAWHRLVRTHFKGTLKPPFNDEARAQAGFDDGYYGALASETRSANTRST